MVAVIVLSLAVVVVVRWRMGHGERRRSEAAARQTTHRPLGEFDARFPMDRLDRKRFRRGSRRRIGF